LVLLVELAESDGATSQLSTICSHRQLQQPTAAHNAENVVVDETAALSPYHRHQVCYHSATKCPTHCSYSPSSAPTQRGRTGSSPPVDGVLDAGGTDRPAHIVIDALRSTSDDLGSRLRRSQITCRILQPSTEVHRSPAQPTSGTGKLIMPVCDDRHRTSVADARTGFANGDCRSQRLLTTQRSLPAAYRHFDANGNI